MFSIYAGKIDLNHPMVEKVIFENITLLSHNIKFITLAKLYCLYQQANNYVNPISFFYTKQGKIIIHPGMKRSVVSYLTNCKMLDSIFITMGFDNLQKELPFLKNFKPFTDVHLFNLESTQPIVFISTIKQNQFQDKKQYTIDSIETFRTEFIEKFGDIRFINPKSGEIYFVTNENAKTSVNIYVRKQSHLVKNFINFLQHNII